MPTLQALRRTLADRFGGSEVFTTGVQLQESGDYTGQASGTEARRRLVSTDLADVDVAGTGSDTSALAFDNSWAWIPDTREQRRIVRNGYTRFVAASVVTTATGTPGAATVGHLTLHRQLTRVIPPNTLFEVHRWPVVDDDRRPGLHNAINRALGLQYMTDRLSFTGLGQSENRYSLAAYPWITEPGQLVEVQDREIISGLDPVPLAGTSEIRFDGDTPYLITGSGVSSSYTFTIDVLRPRNTWIKRGGTWQSSTVGLQDDSDEAQCLLERTCSIAEYLICRAMENRDPAGPQGQWAQRAVRLAVAVGPWLRLASVRVGRSKVSTVAGTVANVPGGLREVAYSNGTNWP